MSPRPHPAFTLALATVLVGVAPVPLAADEPEEPVAERCFSDALTVEEVEAGVLSEIVCYPIDEIPVARGTVDFANVYLGLNGTGTWVTLRGTSCTGGSANFAGNATWDNAISSTDLLTCGNAKHYELAGFGGANQLISGGGIQNMNGTLDNQTTSIQYAP